MASRRARSRSTVIRTTGDRIQDRPLSEAGGKGLFTKEIEEALLAGDDRSRGAFGQGHADRAAGRARARGVLPREDARDAFISRKAATLRELPHGAVVGTASLRRQALVKRLRPDLAVVPLRGNVETRLRKLDAGEVDATLLALAGLKRLGLADAATALLVDRRIPAGGRAGRHRASRRAPTTRRTRALLAADRRSPTPRSRSPPSAPSWRCSTAPAARRSPATPRSRGDALRFRGLIARPDGSEALEAARDGAAPMRPRSAPMPARELKARAGADFFAPV